MAIYTARGALVLDRIDSEAPPDVRESFYVDALIPILSGPRPQTAMPQLRVKILPFQDPLYPNAYTITFLRGVLMYEVDDVAQEVVLLDVSWV